MKKIFAVALVTSLALAGLAFADGFNASQYQLDSTNVFPTTATQGMPLVSNGTPKQPVTALSACVSDYNDGGVDDDFIWLGNVYGHVYEPTTKYPDGGAGWNRAPQFDFTVDAGTLTGAPIQAMKARGYCQYFPSTTPIPNTSAGSRIYFSTTSVLGNDAGTPRHTILIEGRYVFPPQ